MNFLKRLFGMENCSRPVSSAKTPSGYEEKPKFLWRNPRNSLLKVVVDQEAPVIVGFQPVVEVNLVQIGSHKLLAQFLSFRTQEGYLESSKHCDQ